MSAPTIKTERLILRNIEKEDANNLKYLLCPEIENNSGPYMPHNFDQLAEHVQRISGDTAWGITLCNGEFIGDIGVFSIKDGAAEMAWYLDPRYQHCGYAFEAGKAVIQYCFKELCIKSISAEIEANNISSRRLAEKLGFKLKNIALQADFYGKKTDVSYYCINNPFVLPLETERLIIRRWQEGDIDGLRSIIFDADVIVPAGGEVCKCEEDCKETLLFLTKSEGDYAVQLKDSGVVIGNICVNGDAKNDENTRNLGYCFAKAHWNKGYLSEALCAIIEYSKGFANALSATQHNNEKSEYILKKFGFKQVDSVKQTLNDGSFVYVPYYLLELK